MKRGHMVGFEDIIAEFAPEFYGFKDPAEELRHSFSQPRSFYRNIRGSQYHV
jgi:hypothetical protein